MSTRLPPPAFEQKIVTSDALASRAAALPKPVVMTNGVFDILHRGHVTYLAQARALGGSLIVAVNSDASVKMLGKGDDRPINTECDRAAVLAALESVDLVVVFTDKVPLKVIEKARRKFRTGLLWRPQADSNRCTNRERVVSWASRRWGP